MYENHIRVFNSSHMFLFLFSFSLCENCFDLLSIKNRLANHTNVKLFFRIIYSYAAPFRSIRNNTKTTSIRNKRYPLKLDKYFRFTCNWPSIFDEKQCGQCLRRVNEILASLTMHVIVARIRVQASVFKHNTTLNSRNYTKNRPDCNIGS